MPSKILLNFLIFLKIYLFLLLSKTLYIHRLASYLDLSQFCIMLQRFQLQFFLFYTFQQSLLHMQLHLTPPFCQPSFSTDQVVYLFVAPQELIHLYYHLQKRLGEMLREIYFYCIDLSLFFSFSMLLKHRQRVHRQLLTLVILAPHFHQALFEFDR